MFNLKQKPRNFNFVKSYFVMKPSSVFTSSKKDGNVLLFSPGFPHLALYLIKVFKSVADIDGSGSFFMYLAVRV